MNRIYQKPCGYRPEVSPGRVSPVSCVFWVLVAAGVLFFVRLAFGVPRQVQPKFAPVFDERIARLPTSTFSMPPLPPGFLPAAPESTPPSDGFDLIFPSGGTGAARVAPGMIVPPALPPTVTIQPSLSPQTFEVVSQSGGMLQCSTNMLDWVDLGEPKVSGTDIVGYDFRAGGRVFFRVKP